MQVLWTNKFFVSIEYFLSLLKAQVCSNMVVRSVANGYGKEATLTWGSEPQSWKQAVLSSRLKSSSSKELQLAQVAILDSQKVFI